jgi:LmbE family N-acetylglucosaminyl deacetylase
MPVRTLLAVHAHPDDETIITGGTLARYSAEGVRTVVVTCTDGELGWLGGVTPADRLGSVGGIRQRELEAAAARLGLSRLVQLGYADSGMAGTPDNAAPGAFWSADLVEAAQRLVAVIEAERPQVMLAYDETGCYGHPDHVKAHQVALAAYAASGSAKPAKLYLVRVPLGWSRRFVAALRAAGIPAPGSAPCGGDAGPHVREVGVADELVTTSIDVRAYVEAKRAALACHQSQMPPEHFLMRMPPAVADQFWSTEFYSRVEPPFPAGSALETDLFAGLD